MVISTIWPPPTSHSASSWTSPLRLIPFVTMGVGHRPDELSPVSSPAFTTSRSPYAGGFFTAAFPGSLPFPWPSLCYEQLGSLLSRFRIRISTLQDSLYVAGCCFASLSGSYIASAPPDTQKHIQKHWMFATWPPDCYHDRTYTGK
jgi:hypothetical protein